MRKDTFLISAVALVVLLLMVAPLGATSLQQGQEQEKKAEGVLKAVDLEQSKIVLAQEDDAELTLVVTADTLVRDPEGAPTTLAALEGKEGQALTAQFVELGDQRVAVSIQLIA